MIKSKQTLLLILVFYLLGSISCKKETEHSFQIEAVPNLPDLKNKFLDVSGKLPRILGRISSSLRKEDNKKEFVNSLANFQGIPVWEKAKYINKSKKSGNTSLGDESDSTVFVPLVLTDSHFVNAFLVCTEKDSTFEFNLFNCNDYKKYGYTKNPGKPNANNIVDMFIGFEYSVFGHDEFIINDQQLERFKQFGNGSTNVLKVQPKKNTNPITANVWIPVLDCWEEAWFYYDPNTGSHSQTTEWVEVCNTVYEYVDFGGGGSSSGSGSGYTWVPANTGGGTSTGGSGSSGYSSTVNYVKNKAFLNTIQANWLSNNSSFASLLYTNIQNDISNQDPIGDDIYLASAPGETVIATKISVDAGIDAYLDGPFDFTHYNLISQYSTVSPDIHNPSAYWALFKAQCAILKYENPEWSSYKVYWEASKELVHLGLDVAGLFPVAGEIADFTNGVLYTIEGDGVNATLSYASAIPLVGWWPAGIKMGMKTVQLTSATTTTLKWIRSGTSIAFGSRSQLRKVLKLVKFDGKIAHHIIPWEFRDNLVVQMAAKANDPDLIFHMNEFANGIPLSSAIHAGDHLNYNARIKIHLDDILDEYPNMTPDQAAEHLRNLINRIRAKINQDQTTHINELIF